MDINPCGTNLGVYIVSPDKLNERHFSMLLAAQISGREVELRNADSPQREQCHGQYSTFNFVKIK